MTTSLRYRHPNRTALIVVSVFMVAASLVGLLHLLSRWLSAIILVLWDVSMGAMLMAHTCFKCSKVCGVPRSHERPLRTGMRLLSVVETPLLEPATSAEVLCETENAEHFAFNIAITADRTWMSSL